MVYYGSPDYYISSFSIHFKMKRVLFRFILFHPNFQMKTFYFMFILFLYGVRLNFFCLILHFAFV